MGNPHDDVIARHLSRETKVFEARKSRRMSLLAEELSEVINLETVTELCGWLEMQSRAMCVVAVAFQKGTQLLLVSSDS